MNVLAKDLAFPEGPVIDDLGNVYCVELLGECITKVSSKTNEVTKYHVGGRPNGMMLIDESTLLFCDSGFNSVRSLNVDTGETKTLVAHVNQEPLREPNDLIMDSDGNLLFTCPGGSVEESIGYMCCLDSEGQVHVIAKDMYFPNGLLLINNEEKIIINETWQHRLLIGDWNKDTKRIENIELFYDIGGVAEPDGLALSDDNLIYASVYATGMVWVFDLNGNLVKQIKLPGNNPTNLYFDPNNPKRLVVTETEKGELLEIILD